MARRSTKTANSSLQKPIVDEKILTGEIGNLGRDFLRSYGAYVVENRAIPDYRDGLKPVHRACMWSMYNLRLMHNKPFKKSARTVGEVIGKWHPHGDASVYAALVGLAGTKDKAGKWERVNSVVPLIEGQGNFGDNFDIAAAQRYTESRLSEFAEHMLLGSDYIAVSEKIKNFSEDDKIPLVLPAKLPLYLINGGSGIAYGVSFNSPSFHIDGIVKLVIKCLRGEKLLAKDLAANLQPRNAYGGKCISASSDIVDFAKAGKGSLDWIPEMEITPKSVLLKSVCPGMQSKASLEKLSAKLAAMKEISLVANTTDKSGFRFEINFARGVADTKGLIDTITKMITTRVSYNLGITIRKAESTNFRRINVVQLLERWTEWRVRLELKVIKFQIQQWQRKLDRLKLLLLAANHLDVIFAALKRKDTEEYTAKQLKITVEQANVIFDYQVRRLKSLEVLNLKKTIKEIENTIKLLQKDLGNPQKRIIESLTNLDTRKFII